MENLFSLSGLLIERNEPDEPNQPDKLDRPEVEGE